MNGNFWDGFAFISRDWPAPGSKLYFTSNRRMGTFDIDYWEAEWIPFRITAIRTGSTGVQLDLTGKAGRSFVVQGCEQLQQAGWTNLGTPILATNDATSVTVPLSSSASQPFYRVALP